MAPHRVSGTLLCHAGAHRLAFDAQDVAQIDAAGALEGRFQSARLAFGEPAGAARVLVAASGEAVGVDTLEIDSGPFPVLPTPEVIGRVAGGCLEGFLFAQGEYWPLVRLVDFERFLAGLSRRAA